MGKTDVDSVNAHFGYVFRLQPSSSPASQLTFSRDAVAVSAAEELSLLQRIQGSKASREPRAAIPLGLESFLLENIEF